MFRFRYGVKQQGDSLLGEVEEAPAIDHAIYVSTMYCSISWALVVNSIAYPSRDIRRERSIFREKHTYALPERLSSKSSGLSSRKGFIL